MIVGNCCSGCQRHNKATSPPATPRTSGAILSTSFRRPISRRVRFDAAPSLPERIRASAVGLARAAIATPDLNALSGLASQGTSKVTQSFNEPSTWAQSVAARPYWEQESCTSIYSDPANAFRTALPNQALQSSFDGFVAQQPSLDRQSQAASDQPWRDEFLSDASETSTSMSSSISHLDSDDDRATTLEESTQSPQWDEQLNTVLKRLLPDVEARFGSLQDESSTDSVGSTRMDPSTVKRLRMILQHLAYAPPCPAMLSVR